MRLLKSAKNQAVLLAIVAGSIFFYGAEMGSLGSLAAGSALSLVAAAIAGVDFWRSGYTRDGLQDGSRDQSHLRAPN